MKWACVGLLLAAACADRVVIAPDEIALQVVTGAAEVEFGRAIPLTVVRSWRKGLVPQEWGPQAFAPLSLRLVHAARAENATHVQDTRRYDAFVFGRDVVQLTVPAFRARAADGSERIATGNDLTLRVSSTLPVADDGQNIRGEIQSMKILLEQLRLWTNTIGKLPTLYIITSH